MVTNSEGPPTTGVSGRNKAGLVDKDKEAGDEEQTSRFSPKEEADMVAESNTLKVEANTLFKSGSVDAAINKYVEAIAACPTYLEYEQAVLQSNLAACHLKLDEWKEAADNATAALDSLDRLEREEKEKSAEQAKAEADSNDVEAEIISAGAAKAGPAIVKPDEDPAEAARRKRQDDVARIRSKALMRRARAKSELGGWSNLEGAISDYKRLAAMPDLSAVDKKIVQSQLRVLPPRAKAAQDQETAEMWGKLKELGNGILRPFGLSTDSFQMNKDEKTGGYSMNFQGGGPGGGTDKP
ncbi:hypothetical protein B0T26DRAFT_309939 [Lasiosphaeria miniovina]|uniref:Tetratricopeptide repeat protein 1 n=1 Tax=Lasiosphaeria miniovina TaxID=1954250 RepID=A0AA40E0B6_9PEZI|nr:uncharacterized protein B0T26DRAFT_309939 [Lasiosphaeria miniovina]KAK0717993.1 hypothetical protein B0T26DRAFT_309939 [Lasiosphaeria miniovina]